MELVNANSYVTVTLNKIVTIYKSYITKSNITKIATGSGLITTELEKRSIVY